MAAQKSQIFSNVAILIYVFDATTKSSTEDWEKDVKYFLDCLEALRSNENSEGAGVWVLVNKMDLIGDGAVGPAGDQERQRVFQEKKEELERRAAEVKVDGEEAPQIRCFPTSIWNESLFRVGPDMARFTDDYLLIPILF